MGDLLGRLFEALAYIWPFRIVWQYELGGRYLFGRFRKVVGPGIYCVVPYFMEVKSFSCAPEIISTRRLDITLQDGRHLTYQASAQVQMVDFNKAINGVDSYTETTREVLEAVVSDKMADIEPSRLEPAGRRRLLSDLTRWVNEGTSVFGIESRRVRFTTFVLNARPFRLLQEVEGNNF
jgi:hypothetical protein